MTTTDPRLATTISEFLAAGSSSTVISYPKLVFTEKSGDILYVVHSVLEDYLYELKKASEEITFSQTNIVKYQYNPKRLASDIYGSTELYYILLRINDMCDIKQFDLSSGKLMMLTTDNMSTMLNSIYSAEKDDIATYNKIHSS